MGVVPVGDPILLEIPGKLAIHLDKGMDMDVDME